ncbi:MAG: hypothetical protein ACM3X6_13700 [Patescibacteria group bacterium]
MAVRIECDGVIETMASFYEKDRIVACVERLPSFLPLYNEAAGACSGFRYDRALVDEFSRIWG